MQETEPDELPMDVVLDEIRQMLLADTENKQSKELPKEVAKTEEVFFEDVSVVADVPEKETKQTEYFLLTPEMRCDLTENKVELSDIIQKRTQQVMDKLNQQQNVDETLSPALESWLSKNLPSLIEKAIAEKLSK
jgi:cell pole-organizing protein PopZ